MAKMISDMVGGVPLGETETGSAWVLKALHPADKSVLTAPMPVNETRQFASVQFDQMEVESIPSTFSTSLPWDMDIFVHRDPCLLYSFVKRQAGHADVVGYRFSTQHGVPDYDAAKSWVRLYSEKFRLTSHSFTAYFDAASTSDQGHIVCGQVEYPRMNSCAHTTGMTLDLQAHIPYTFYQDPLPTYDNIMQSTRCYQAPASMGVYAPSKLQNIGKWVSTNDTQAMLGLAETGNTFINLGDTSIYEELAPAGFYGTFPYMSMAGPDGFKPVFQQVDTSMTVVFMRGCSATSQWRTTMRWSLDFFVRPGSPYAPFVRMPPVEDHMALKMYAEVSRRMPDGFDGSHNFLGTLLPLIAKIASSVLPSVVPAISEWIGGRQEQRNQERQAGIISKSAGLGELALGRLLGPKRQLAKKHVPAFNRAMDLIRPLWQASEARKKRKVSRRGLQIDRPSAYKRSLPAPQVDEDEIEPPRRSRKIRRDD